MHPETTPESGFSVLEAIVAIGLLAIAFLPLLQLQGQFVGTVAAIDRVEDRVDARDLAAKTARIINFDAQPTGRMVFNDRTIAWTSTIARPAKRVRGPEGVPDRFAITLYDVSFRIEPVDDRDAVNILTRGLGWTPVSTIAESF